MDSSVRCAAAGLLVNVCGAGGAGGAAEAARALCSAARARDVPAAALLTRALWNAHAHRPLEPAHAHQVATALALFIGEFTEYIVIVGVSCLQVDGRRALCSRARAERPLRYCVDICPHVQ